MNANLTKSAGRTGCVAALLTCCVLPPSLDAAEADNAAIAAASAYPETTRYEITRNGKTVGEHTVTFSIGDTDLRVDVESNITVTVLKVPVFKFNYTATETWQDGKLIDVDATTKRGGDVSQVNLQNDAQNEIEFASNHWNPGVLNSQAVFNTLTGKVSSVDIEKLGETTLSAGGTSVAATHYRYSGDIRAEVWYDEQMRWIQLQFEGDDGSTIVYTAQPLDLAS